MDKKYLSVRNMHKYQHYRLNKPKWIKLYGSLWLEYEFFKLNDTSKAHLIGLFFLCSQHNNILPFDRIYIENYLKTTTSIDFEAILSSGFIVAHDGGSIKTLEKSKKKSSKNGPTEIEIEIYKEEITEQKNISSIKNENLTTSTRLHKIAAVSSKPATDKIIGQDGILL